jgi:1-acyl-sn-glycerol-3-phosphate acyltransferase
VSAADWRRRAVTFPAVVLGLTLFVALSPVLYALALGVDLLRWAAHRTPWMGLRLLTFIGLYLSAEVVGLGWFALIWLTSGAGARRHERLLARTYQAQRAWTRVLFEGAVRLLHLRFHVEGDAEAGRGQALVFMQHASVLDTLVPTVFLTARHGLALRWVLKKELLVSPSLDLAGHWLPNVFVDRGSREPQAEIDRVGALGQNLGPHEGVLIYPEGTRFTPDKQSRAMERLSAADPARMARVAELSHMLPARTGGPLALLAAAPGVDVVLVAHHGLEGFALFADLWGGRFLRKDVHVRMWRVPRALVPAEREAQVAWLDARWVELDQWVAAQARGTP